MKTKERNMKYNNDDSSKDLKMTSDLTLGMNGEPNFKLN